ncbi:MAG: diguanylate cyclase [Pyrinomonadaceae bacterium]
MKEISSIITGDTLGRVAEESGLAIAIVDEYARQAVVSNNNSICRKLNPGNKFSPACFQFCGIALAKALEAGKMVGFECHAGLDSRAIAGGTPDKPFVAIVGRTFLKAENYRRATERAIRGDWSSYAPTEFFENILLTGSPDALTKTAGQVEQLLNELQNRELQNKTTAKLELENTTYDDDTIEIVDKAVGEIPQPEINEPEIQQSEKKSPDALAWRAFFGSILKTDYSQAIASILEFVAHQYKFSSLIWLEKSDGRFENKATFGDMTGRKVRLGISSEDHRLADALHNETSLELGERAKETAADEARVMNLFPIGIGDEISAAVAILDRIDDENKKKQIARFCHSIAPQLEILRLRNEVSDRDEVTNAVRTFSDSLKNIDADDYWQQLTQNAAEMMRSERASLLIMNEKSGEFEIKAMIGARQDTTSGEEIGSRVAKIVFSKNKAVIVSDVSATGLPLSRRSYKTKSFLSCPINVGQKTIGVMSFTDRADRAVFDKSSLDLFLAVAPQLAVAIDRATLKEKAGEFEQLSVTDPLTGLLNRRYIEERMLEEIKRSNRHGFPMSFMMLDVDHFKSYNDSHGHPAGDAALKMVAQVIRETLRDADVAARFGGEEFSILLPQTTAEEAATIAERLRSNIEHTDFPHRHVTTSIGVASCSAELCASADLVSAADKALYEAKRQGRNRVRTFEEMNTIRNA